MVACYAQISFTRFVWCYCVPILTHMDAYLCFVLINLAGMEFIILDTHIPCGPPCLHPSQLLAECGSLAPSTIALIQTFRVSANIPSFSVGSVTGGLYNPSGEEDREAPWPDPCLHEDFLWGPEGPSANCGRTSVPRSNPHLLTTRRWLGNFGNGLTLAP